MPGPCPEHANIRSARLGAIVIGSRKGQPRLALYSLTESARTPFHAETNTTGTVRLDPVPVF